MRWWPPPHACPPASPKLNHILARSIYDSVTERALAAEAALLWPGASGRVAATTVRTLARARPCKGDRVARRAPLPVCADQTIIARAVADCRPPIDRTLDDRLDAAAGVHRATPSAPAPPSDIAPPTLQDGTNGSTRRSTPHSTLCATVGLPPAAPTFESPFDAGQPCPVLAVQTGDTPGFGATRKRVEWPEWEAAMMKEIDGLHQSGTISEGVPEDGLPSWDTARGRAAEVIDGFCALYASVALMARSPGTRRAVLPTTTRSIARIAAPGSKPSVHPSVIAPSRLSWLQRA
jgi:hypothetical protein